MQSANHIVNHNNVNLADLQKQISDLQEIVSSNVFKISANKHDKHYHSLFSDSRNLATTPARISLKTNGAKTIETHLGKRRAAKERELNEKIP